MSPDRKANDMWTSVSAITDAGKCLRRWWFNKVVKLPQEQRKATIFGDVTHAVLERFFLADDRGLNGAGQPVDLYPLGWMTMKGRWSKEDTLYTVADTEAALIKMLIDCAIAQGILVRSPGRIIEKQISQVIYTQGYAKTTLKGYIDLDTPTNIIDHKTAKDKKYILSKDKLKKSIQMMGYAYAKYLTGHTGTLWLTHNNFIKDFDNPKVIQRSVEVTQFEVQDFFNNTILPLVRKMLNYHIKYPKTLIAKWRDIPGANNPNQECNYNYGRACPYIGICSGTCSLDSYLIKYGITVNQLVGNTEIEQKGCDKMPGLMERIKAEQEAGRTGGQQTATPPAVTQEQVNAAVQVQEPAAPQQATGLSNLLAKIQGQDPPATQPVTQSVTQPVTPPATTVVPPAQTRVAEDKQKAPWYTEYNGLPCGACSGNAVLGYNSKMTPCRICTARAVAEKRPTSGAYTIDVLEGGKLRFTLNNTSQPAETVTVSPPPQSQVTSYPADQTTQTAPSQPSAMEQAIQGLAQVPLAALSAPLVADPSPEAGQALIGGSGFTLLVGCTVAYASTLHASFADRLLDEMLNEISEATGVHWTAVEHFALMQAIDQRIPALVTSLEGRVVVSIAPSKGSALARLIDGLRPIANIVVYPFAI